MDPTQSETPLLDDTTVLTRTGADVGDAELTQRAFFSEISEQNITNGQNATNEQELAADGNLDIHAVMDPSSTERRGESLPFMANSTLGEEISGDAKRDENLYDILMEDVAETDALTGVMAGEIGANLEVANFILQQTEEAPAASLVLPPAGSTVPQYMLGLESDGGFQLGHMSPSLISSIKLGLAFLVLYFSVSIAQAFVTPRHHGVGFVALAVLNGCFVIGSLLGGRIIDGIHLGLRTGMVISSLVVAVFVLSTILTSTPSFLIMGSAIGGFFLGILWLSQGVYLSRATLGYPHAKGRITSVFLLLYSLSTLLGSVGSMVMVAAGLDEASILLVLAFVAVAAAVFFVTLPVMKNTSIRQEREMRTLMSQFSAMIALARTPKLKYLMLLFISQGISYVFTSGVFPVAVTSRSNQSAFVAVLVAYGIGLAISSPILGWIFDIKGYNWLFRLEFLIQVCMISLVNIGIALHGTFLTVGMNLCFIAAGFFAGMNDSIFSTLSNTLLLLAYHEHHEVVHSFSIYRCVYGFTCACGYLLAGVISPIVVQILMFFALMVATFGVGKAMSMAEEEVASTVLS